MKAGGNALRGAREASPIVPRPTRSYTWRAAGPRPRNRRCATMPSPRVKSRGRAGRRIGRPAHVSF
jgi:hypothetical protein